VADVAPVADQAAVVDLEHDRLDQFVKGATWSGTTAWMAFRGMSGKAGSDGCRTGAKPPRECAARSPA
jgi:hypothetical protein